MSRRGGRNRKPGRREPNGRTQRKSQNLEAAEVQQTVMAYRKKYGLSEEDAKDPKAVDVFGRLALEGKLHSNETMNVALWQAGEFFRETHTKCHKALLSQQMRSGGDLEPVPRGWDDDDGTDPDYVRQCAAARRLDEQLTAKIRDRAGGEALTAVVQVICENTEPLDIAALRAGLHALVAKTVLQVA